MEKSPTWSAVAVAAMLLSVACVEDQAEPLLDFEGEPIAEAEAPSESFDGEQTVAPEPLAVIEGADGKVEWLPPEQLGDEPEVVITVRGLATPIIMPDLVERVGAVQAYLALVDDDQPLHPALVRFVDQADLPLMADPEQRRRIRASNLSMQREFELSLDDFASEPQANGSGCSAAQKNHARNFYGAAYSAGAGSPGSKTCGQHMAFHNAYGNTYYCNKGGECDYALGGCDPGTCTVVRGRTRALRARFKTGAGGTAAFKHYGARYRFGFKNCSDTYDAVMQRKRGNNDWIHTTIKPNSMQIRVGGYPPPAGAAKAINDVAWAAWKEHHNWSTSATPFNQFKMAAQTEGFFCGDIIQRFDTYDSTPPSCNGGNKLCDDNTCWGTNAQAGCWD